MMLYCVRTEPLDGENVYRSINLNTEVFCVRLTPRSPFPGKKMKLPPGVPMFTTADGDWLLLTTLEKYADKLLERGYDIMHSKTLVKVDLIDYITVTQHGCMAHFKNSKRSVEISRSKAEEYSHLVKDQGLNPLLN